MKDLPPGDAQVPVPPPVDEEPPHDRFCDLVMTGGVASGVVYPWAVVEIARAYRFRNIGGTSVGAMAAVLAAAAEFGRRTGFDQSFEPLRRIPGALGEKVDGQRTRMLSLFQANAHGRRLVALWGVFFSGHDITRLQTDPKAAATSPPPRTDWRTAVRALLHAYRWPLVLGAALACLLWLLFSGLSAVALDALLPHSPALESLSLAGHSRWRLSALGWVSMFFNAVLVMLAGALLGLLWAVWRDIRLGVIANNLGLCKGGSLEGPSPKGEKRPGLCEWLHEGIQASAGLKARDRPLSFRDLWCAPARPGAAHLPCSEHEPSDRRSINLQMITTNLTHGRPYRLPLTDTTSRLFYKPSELKDYFPPAVLDALVAASRRYQKLSSADPEAIAHPEQFFELPGADMPIVVAARLSLSFPLLFAAVPLWAIDYEVPDIEKRPLRRCLFTDGGASSNFPIHLFDAAIPRWPTFGLWLDRRDTRRPPRLPPKPWQVPMVQFEGDDVWLPEFNGQGRGDNWDRFDPESAESGEPEGQVKPDGKRAKLKHLAGFVLALITSVTDWRDRTSMRLPHVRNRVARLWLHPGETGLHIGMSAEQILNMADRYGTTAGQKFVDRFAGPAGQGSPAWDEQRWLRLLVLVNGLRERVAGLKASAEWTAHTQPLAAAIAQSCSKSPVRQRGRANKLDAAQAGSLSSLLAEMAELEKLLRTYQPQRYKPEPEPELRLRAPL